MNLSELEATQLSKKKQVAEALIEQGVELLDWQSLHVSGTLNCGAGVVISPHVVIEGDVVLGDNVIVGPYSYIRNSKIAANTQIRAFSSLEEVEVEADCRIGPYARLRDRSVVSSGSSVGNFVELKATQVGAGGRINHLAFLGDTTMAAKVTIGAGVITCNYDGAKTVETQIDYGAFVGCGSELVAPLSIGRHATIGAGSTITEDVDDGGLTVARARQARIKNWKRTSD